MPQSVTEYRHGRILGAYLRARRRNTLLHPAIILSSDEQITEPQEFDPRRGGENLVVVIGASTKYRSHPDPYHLS